VTLNWPAEFERTEAVRRKSGSKFSTNFQRTEGQIGDAMDRMGVDHWSLNHERGTNGDPGVVVRWTDDGTDYAVACDAYRKKRANIRALYLWIEETRKRGNRPVETGQSDFAAAALPGPGEDAVAAGPPPHEVLGVTPDAPDAVTEGAARSLKREYHFDNGGDSEQFKRVTKAEQAMLGWGDS
jgi:hypothetical protein